MSVKVICSRPGGAYLVEREGGYCLVNLQTKRYNESSNPNVFLKLGYFEDAGELEPEVLDAITAILENPDSRLEIR